MKKVMLAHAIVRDGEARKETHAKDAGSEAQMDFLYGKTGARC